MNAAEVKSRLTGRWPDDRYLHIYEAPTRHDRQGGAIDVLVLGLWPSLGLEIDAVEVKVSYSDWKKEWEQVEWHVTDHADRTVVHHRKPDEHLLRRLRGDDPWVNQRLMRDGLPPVPEGFEPTVQRVTKVNTHKSVDWRQRAHRFWVAAPAALASKIKLDVDAVPELAGWGVLAVDAAATRVLATPKKNHNPIPLTHSTWLGIVRAAADSGFQALLRAEERGRRMEAERVKAQTIRASAQEALAR